MRKILAALAFIGSLLLSLPTFADDLDFINRQVQKPEFLQAGFTQHKFLKILTMPLVSSGQFWISQNDGVVWAMEKPVYSQVVITPHGVTFSDQQSQKTARSMEHIGKILQGLLSGDLMKINEQFSVVVKNKGDANTDWQLQLEPKSVLLRKGIQSISLSGKTFIRQLVLHEAGGDRTEILFHDAQAVNALPTEVINAFGKP